MPSKKKRQIAITAEEVSQLIDELIKENKRIVDLHEARLRYLRKRLQALTPIVDVEYKVTE